MLRAIGVWFVLWGIFLFLLLKLQESKRAEADNPGGHSGESGHPGGHAHHALQFAAIGRKQPEHRLARQQFLQRGDLLATVRALRDRIAARGINIKLVPGGIREIEFTVQVFQLIRGGHERSLQQQPTLPVLAALGLDFAQVVGDDRQLGLF